MILDQIVKTKRMEVEESKTLYPLSAVREGLKKMAPARNFKKALLDRKCAIIAEVKQTHPQASVQFRSWLNLIGCSFDSFLEPAIFVRLKLIILIYLEMGRGF